MRLCNTFGEEAEALACALSARTTRSLIGLKLRHGHHLQRVEERKNRVNRVNMQFQAPINISCMGIQRIVKTNVTLANNRIVPLAFRRRFEAR